jgi:hypothetical protein
MTSDDKLIIEAIGEEVSDLLAEERAEIRKLVEAEVALLRAEMRAAVAEARADLATRMANTLDRIERTLPKAGPAEVAQAPPAKPN